MAKGAAASENRSGSGLTTLNWMKRALKCDLWSNRELLTSVSRHHDEHPDLLKLFGHIVAAQVLWLNRLQDEEQKMEIWPELPMDECATWLYRLEIGWGAFLDNLGDAELENEISYTNTRGEDHSSTIGDVVNHVLLHGAYHRGQIAIKLRQAGIDPPYTDYIHATRERLI